MIKKTKNNNLIIVLSVFLVLVSLFMLGYKQTNSWFTSSRQIEITTTIQGLDIQILQGASTNVTSGTSYITLSQEILPDTAVPLDLRVKNNTTKTTNVKFKFEVYVGVTKLSGVTVTLNTTNFEAGTGANADYFVYKSNPLAANTTVQMMTAFTVPYSAFSTYDCDTVHVVLTVVAED